jgi:ribosomal protein S18 acetylase RimI-like enzyme
VPDRLRNLLPDDHGTVIRVVDDWWGGRPMRHMLPRLFFTHFTGTSFAIEDDDGALAGFLCGFLSPARPDEGYVHFVGVNPRRRGRGLGRTLYDAFFAVAQRDDRHVIRAVTSPLNTGSRAFHRALAFTEELVAPGYDGPGEDRVLLVRRLPAR